MTIFMMIQITQIKLVFTSDEYFKNGENLRFNTEWMENKNKFNLI